MADFKKLFIIGCPRSGTTWMQLLLARHPGVATAPETQIFAYYLDHFRRQWRHEHEGPGRVHQGNAGLSRLLSGEEFEELCRLNARTVLEKIAARNPRAAVVVEKSPRHALEAEFIRRIFPDAYFLHVIRDPRDTAASLLAAGRSWAPWAPRNAIDAARLWARHVQSARRLAGRAGRYREIRYEALASRAALELHDVLAWLAIPEEPAFCETAVEACKLARLQVATSGRKLPLPGERSPRGFFRRGTVGGWRDELSRTEAKIVEHICREPMSDAGYVPALRAGWVPPIRLRAHDAIQRVRESIDWQLQRLLFRI